MNQSALKITGLSFSYQDNPDILRDINLEVSEGERVGLIGPNGAGKTTLFLSICGVLKPSTGQISVLNKPVQSGGFNPDIGMVFQNPDDQLFCPSVWEDVAFGPQNMGLSKETVESRTKESLSMVGHLKLADRPPHHLSGGEKRMVSIAGVLAMKPTIIVYDEPSANLGMRSRRRVIELIKSSEQTVLISSHDLELLLEVCNRVIILDEGKIIANGNPAQIMSNRELMESHGQEMPHSLSPHTKPHH